MKGADYFEDTINQIDDSTGTWTSSLMCTQDYCACPPETNFTLWTETELNSWNRTNSIIKAVDPQYKLLFKNVTAGSISYPTFYECYKYILTRKSTLATNSQAQKVEELSDDFIDLLKVLENELNCNGICQPGLFWFLKPVTDGPPGQNCVEGLRDMFKKNTTNIGIALIISCFFTFCAFIVQYGLWRKNKSD